MDRPEIDPAHDEDAVTPEQSTQTGKDDARAVVDADVRKPEMGCKIGELRIAAERSD
jgi:hypothetical protein